MQGHFNIPSSDVDKIQRMYDRSGISRRYSVLPDFNPIHNKSFLFHANHVPDIEERMQVYFHEALPLCLQAVKQLPAECLEKITHLITVSCTGMAAPGLDIQLIEALHLDTSIQRSSINFMGCYAAIHALKQAQAICKADTKARVLLVDVELCTLHFQSEYSLEQMASSMLFGDNAAAILVGNEPGLFEIGHFYSELALEGQKDMAWQLCSSGFKMSLSTFVPDLIAARIQPMLKKSLQQSGLQKIDIRYWAIHPGGQKILREIQTALELKDEDLRYSKQILNDYGNMSSVTLLFLLHVIGLQSKETGMVFGAAFGPGLTLETLTLRKC